MIWFCKWHKTHYNRKLNKTKSSTKKTKMLNNSTVQATKCLDNPEYWATRQLCKSLQMNETQSQQTGPASRKFKNSLLSYIPFFETKHQIPSELHQPKTQPSLLWNFHELPCKSSKLNTANWYLMFIKGLNINFFAISWTIGWLRSGSNHRFDLESWFFKMNPKLCKNVLV